MASGKPQKSALDRRQLSNKITGYTIPCFLVAIVTYASYAFIGQVVVDYYLSPSKRQPDLAAGIPILIIYVLLLTIFVLSYRRLLSTSILRRREPDDYCPKHQAAPKGTQSSFMADKSPPQVGLPNICLTDARRAKLQETAADLEKGPVGPGQYLSVLDHERILSGSIDPPPGLEGFYSRDVFQCDPRGLPRWCGTCNSWKPDRVHHSDDLGRCVANFDHFCPWVGGAVAESNYKFFVQFNFYTVLYTAFIVVVVGCVLADKTKNHDSVNGHQLALIGLAGFFLLFTSGMLLTCVTHMAKNSTTVDNIDSRNRTMYLAVRIPEDFKGQYPATYTPQPPQDLKPGTTPDPIPIWQNVLTFPITTSHPTMSRLSTTLGPRHTFAVFQTPRGMNPWGLGTARNLCQVMGHKWYDWFLPIQKSPNSEHGTASLYPLGNNFESMRRDVFEGRLP